MIASFTRVIAGHTITAHALPSQQPMVDDVLDVLGGIAEAEPLRAGLRVRFGWSMLTLDAADDGFVVCEPDFERNPLREIRPRIDTTLDVAAKQSALARAVEVEPVDATFDQFMVVAPGAMQARDVQMYRDTARQPDDSGWSLTQTDESRGVDDATEWEAVHTHVLLREKPAALPVLILPPGYAAVLEGGVVRVVIDADGRDRLPSMVSRPRQERTN